MNWDNINKGSQIDLRNQKRTAINRSSFHNSVVSFRIFDSQSKGCSLHYVEFHLQKTKGMYLGICSNEGEINLERKVETSDKVCVIGPQVICNSIGVLIEDPGIDFDDDLFFGLLIDMKKLEASYVIYNKNENTNKIETEIVPTFKNIPSTVKVFACLDEDNVISISRYVNEKEKIDEYLQNKGNVIEISQKEFKPYNPNDVENDDQENKDKQVNKNNNHNDNNEDDNDNDEDDEDDKDNWDSALHRAIKNKESTESLIKLIEESKEDLQLTDSKGNTPLHNCFLNQAKIEVIKKLIESKADVNARNEQNQHSILFSAFIPKDVDLEKINLLIDSKADVNYLTDNNHSCLHIALLRRADITKVKLLLDKKVNVNIQDNKGIAPFHLCCDPKLKLGPRHMRLLVQYKADVNIRDNDGYFGLYVFFQNNLTHLEKIKFLILCKAEINLKATSNLYTPLMLAFDADNQVDYEKIKYLIESKADLESKDEDGYTPLIIACGNKHITYEIIKLLIDNKANVNASSEEGYTSLYTALEYQKEEKIIELLIESKAEVNKLTEYNENMLHACLYSNFNNLTLIKKFIELGVNPLLQNNSSYSFFDVQKIVGNFSLLSHLDPFFSNFTHVEFVGGNFHKDKVFQCVQNRVCTLTFTNTLDEDDQYIHQVWFNCLTCGLIEEEGVCLPCSQNCHKDHELSPKFSTFVCDCKECNLKFKREEGDEEEDEEN